MKKLALTLAVVSIVMAACGEAPATFAPTQALPTLPPTQTATLAPTQAPTVTATPMPGIGSRWTRPADGMEMVFVPAGAFDMGSEEGINTEKVVHRVTLDAFWIDLTEVTNGMYDLCVQAGACEPPSTSGTMAIAPSGHYGDPQYKDHPVIYVTWDKANAYCEWADARLPTEAEWEKAARGEDGRNYPWGNDLPSCALANFTNDSIYADESIITISSATCEDDTAAVGGYPDGASPYGALDMTGNVWEWVADRYAAYPAEAVSNPSGPSDGVYRMLRGGAWNIDVPSLYTFTRLAVYPSNSEGNLGFRCARPQP